MGRTEPRDALRVTARAPAAQLALPPAAAALPPDGTCCVPTWSSSCAAPPVAKLRKAQRPRCSPSTVKHVPARERVDVRLRTCVGEVGCGPHHWLSCKCAAPTLGAEEVLLLAAQLHRQWRCCCRIALHRCRRRASGAASRDAARPGRCCQLYAGRALTLGARARARARRMAKGLPVQREKPEAAGAAAAMEHLQRMDACLASMVAAGGPAAQSQADAGTRTRGSLIPPNVLHSAVILTAILLPPAPLRSRSCCWSAGAGVCRRGGAAGARAAGLEAARQRQWQPAGAAAAGMVGSWATVGPWVRMYAWAPKRMRAARPRWSDACRRSRRWSRPCRKR